MKKDGENRKKEMKFLKFAVFMLFLFALALNADAVLLHGFPYSADIGVTLLNQDPDPVEPGKYVDIRFMIENYGASDAANVTFVIIPRYPFSLDTGETAEKNLGRINGGQMGRDSVKVRYRLRVDKDAIDGVNPIKIKYKTANNQEFIEIDEINLSVKTEKIRLLIEDTEIIPGRISPGETAELKIKIKNIFASKINNIRLRLQTNSTSFATLGSDEKIITSLGPNEESEAIFKIISSGDTESKAHQLALITEFSDTLNKNYTKRNTISVIVDEKPSYMLNLDETKVFLSKQKGGITISISNTGQSDMKFTVIELMKSDDYEILSSSKEYLGNLESDDFETAEFEIFVKSKKAEVPLILGITYKDSFNKLIEEKNTVGLKLYNKKDAVKYGLVISSGKSGLFLSIIVIAVIAFLIFRRYKKKKKKANK